MATASQSIRVGSAFSDTALTAATNLAVAALGIFTGMMAARLLGPHGRGELAAIQTYPTLITYLAMLGTDQAVIYFSAREPDRAGSYVASAIMISLVSALPFVAVGYWVMPLLLSAQSARIVAAARWYLLVVPPGIVIYLAFYVLRGRSDFIGWNMLRVMPTMAWMIILLVAVSHGIRDPRWLAWTNFEIVVVLLIPIALTVRRRVPGAYVPRLKHLKPMLTYGLPCIASSFPLLLNMRMDQMLMAALLAPGALGLYVVAVAWSGAINPLMNAVGSVLFPSVAGRIAQADRLRSFTRGTRLAALLAMITTPILAVATPWGIVLLFGRKFEAAIPAGLILVPAGAIWALNIVIEEGFRGLGKPAAVLYAELAGVLTTAVSLYLMLRPMGIVGAAIASLLGYCTVMAALLIQVRLITGESPLNLLRPNSDELRLGIKRLTSLARRLIPLISRA